jgi:hypothetical protein
MQNLICFLIHAVYTGIICSDRLFIHSLTFKFLVILLLALHIQNIVVSNNIRLRLRQSVLVTNLTQNLKLIKFNVLHTTKMKETSQITVLVKLIKLSYFNIIQSCRHD